MVGGHYINCRQGKWLRPKKSKERNSDGDKEMLEWRAAGDRLRFMGLVHRTHANRELLTSLETNTMSTFATVVGLAAAACTTAANLPQVKKAWTTGQTDDISLKMLLLFA